VKGVSDEKLTATELLMIKYTGVDLAQFDFHDVVIDEKGNYVRTIEVGHVRIFF
jgi:hypothetical protein